MPREQAVREHVVKRLDLGLDHAAVAVDTSFTLI